MLKLIGDYYPEVIIDPGHGGTDPGASDNGIIEKMLTLFASLYMFKRFGELGIKRALTRNTDITLTPSERTKLIRESKAKYCISNHINAGGGDGAETIHSIYANSDLATSIANNIVKAGQNLRRVFTRKNSSGTDYYFLHRDTGSVHTVIVEYFFLDSKASGPNSDVYEYKSEFTDWVEGAIKGYCQHTGTKYVAPVATKDVVLPVIQDEVDITVEDKETPQGYLINGLTYVPIRAVSEGLGATVDFDFNANRKVVHVKRGK